MFKKVLVPIDGSEWSLRALKAAAALAERFNSAVTLLYVVSLPTRNPAFSSEFGMIPSTVVDELETDGERLLSQAAAEYPNLAVEKIIRIGHPAGEILAEAKNGYDLIVMGSRGLGEVRGFLMGSVSDKVTHHALCKVMVVH